MDHSVNRRASTITSLVVGASLGLAALPTLGEEHVVNMLTQGGKGSMVFEPAFLKVAPGDTVVFAPTQKGAHNSHATFTPEGAQGWTSPVDTEYRVTLDVEGVYLYVCQPHEILGMVGVIQVGEATNKDAAAAAVATATAKMAMNKERFNDAFAHVE